MAGAKHMEKLRELFASGDFPALLRLAQSELRGCLPEAQHVLYGAIGRAHFELQEYPEAVAALDQALALNPHYAAGLRTRGQAYVELREHQRAVQDLVRAMGAGPQFEANDYLGFAYAALGQQEQAVAAYSAHLAAWVNTWVLARRADALVALRRFAEARNDWETILAAALQDPKYLQDIEDANRVPEHPATSFPAHYRDEPLPQLLHAEGFAPIDVGAVRLNNPALRGAGLYVLSFLGGDFYVGQTIAPVTRLQTHRRTNPDLAGLWFKPTPVDELTAAETAVIALFETKSVRLRNLKQVDFLNQFNAEKQRRWLADSAYNHVSGGRLRNEGIREKYQPRFEQLQKKPYYPFLIGFLSVYVTKAIPNYVASEYTYWSISCLPKYLLSSKCVTRININEVPVLSIFEGEAGNLQVALFASQLPFLSALTEKRELQTIFSGLPTVYFECTESFEKAVPDEIAIWGEQTDFWGMIENEVLLSAIRCFNLRMMNNVGNDVASRRPPSHCLSLADAVLP